MVVAVRWLRRPSEPPRQTESRTSGSGSGLSAQHPREFRGWSWWDWVLGRLSGMRAAESRQVRLAPLSRQLFTASCASSVLLIPPHAQPGTFILSLTFLHSLSVFLDVFGCFFSECDKCCPLRIGCVQVSYHRGLLRPSSHLSRASCPSVSVVSTLHRHWLDG